MMYLKLFPATSKAAGKGEKQAMILEARGRYKYMFN